MEGTNVAQLASLDLSAELFLGETFEYEGLGGVLWVLRPADNPEYRKRSTMLWGKNPTVKAARRQQRKSAAYLSAIETAGEALKKAAHAMLGETAGIEAGVPALRKAVELLCAEEPNGHHDEGVAALKEAATHLLGAKGPDGVVDQALPALYEQYERDSKVAAEEAAEAAGAITDDMEIEAAEEMRAAQIENLANLLVVAVSNVPGVQYVCHEGHVCERGAVKCPECDAAVEHKPVKLDGGPALALQMFNAPGAGEQIFVDVRDATVKNMAKTKKLAEDAAGN